MRRRDPELGVTRISVVAEAIGKRAGPEAILWSEEEHPTLEGEELEK